MYSCSLFALSLTVVHVREDACLTTVVPETCLFTFQFYWIEFFPSIFCILANAFFHELCVDCY